MLPHFVPVCIVSVWVFVLFACMGVLGRLLRLPLMAGAGKGTYWRTGPQEQFALYPTWAVRVVFHSPVWHFRVDSRCFRPCQMDKVTGI